MRLVDAHEEAIADVERGLAFVVRYGNLPRVRERLIARAGIAVEPAGYAVLTRIDAEGEARLSELAGLLGVDASTLSRQVKQLLREGYLARASDPDDGRAAILRLTRRGRQAVERSRVARRAALEELLADWSPQDRRRFGDLLVRFADALMEMTLR